MSTNNNEDRPEQPSPQDVQRGLWRRSQELGEALGLHPAFIRDVQARGQDAVIDRAESVDQTGVHALLLSMAQEFGSFLQEASYREERPDLDDHMQAMVETGHRHGIEPQLSLLLLGSLQEIFTAAAQNTAVAGIDTVMGQEEENR